MSAGKGPVYLIEKALGKGRSVLTEIESKEILKHYGLPVTRQGLAADPGEAVRLAGEIGYPVALKIVSPDLSHKTEAGGVRVNLKSAGEVEETFREILGSAREYKSDAEIWGVLVQEMARPGREIIVGLKRDAIFGPVLLIGLGGVWVELLQDVAVRALPIERRDVLEMLEGLKGGRLLKGYRGEAPVDLEAVVQIALGVARLALDFPEIQEMDLNPVFVGKEGRGATVVDARIILGGTKAAGATGASSGRPGKTEELESLFNPRSVAIVGASADESKNGGRLFKYLVKHGYQGSIYPVNPKEREIRGYPCYPGVRDIPGEVDLACIIVPAKAVAPVLRECVEKRVKSAIVYSSGFAEVGQEGRRLQQELVEIARAGGIRLAGPNTVGIVNPVVHTYTAFGMALEADNPLLGQIAFITQSGALGGALVSRAWEQKIGFSRWIASGNEADLGTADYIEYLAGDPHTKVIGIFMEGVGDGPRFREAAQKAAEAGKPIIVYKTGRSDLGRQSVQSHTGSLAGDDAVYDAVFKKYGILRVRAVWDLLDAAGAFSAQPLPRGNRVGIISTSGGANSMLADECAEAGLTVANFSLATLEKIQQYIPPFGSAVNPVDVTAQVLAKPEIFKKTLEAIVEDASVDSVIIMLTTSADPVASKVAQAVVEVSRACGKPFLIARMGAEFLAPKALPYLIQNNMPVYPTPDRVVRALSYMVRYADFLGGRRKTG